MFLFVIKHVTVFVAENKRSLILFGKIKIQYANCRAREHVDMAVGFAATPALGALRRVFWESYWADAWRNPCAVSRANSDEIVSYENWMILRLRRMACVPVSLLHSAGRHTLHLHYHQFIIFFLLAFPFLLHEITISLKRKLWINAESSS